MHCCCIVALTQHTHAQPDIPTRSLLAACIKRLILCLCVAEVRVCIELKSLYVGRTILKTHVGLMDLMWL